MRPHVFHCAGSIIDSTGKVIPFPDALALSNTVRRRQFAAVRRNEIEAALFYAAVDEQLHAAIIDAHQWRRASGALRTCANS